MIAELSSLYRKKRIEERLGNSKGVGLRNGIPNLSKRERDLKSWRRS